MAKPLPASLDHNGPLHSTFGAFFIGLLLGAVLHGICLLQAFQYFRSPKGKRDAWWLKTAVVCVVSFDFLHLVLLSTGVYHYLISSFHHPEKLEYLTWPILIKVVLPVTNGAIVQGFYTYRIWRLSKGSWILCSIIALLIVAEFGFGLAWCIISMRMEQFRDLLRLQALPVTVNAIAFSIDVTIAVSLCILLHRARTGFQTSDSLINSLIVFGIGTGMLTSVFAMASLVFVVAFPKDFITATFYLCLGRLYTNSFLATLNTRNNLNRHTLETSEPGFDSLPSMELAKRSHMKNISIRIDTSSQQSSGDMLPGEKRIPGF